MNRTIAGTLILAGLLAGAVQPARAEVRRTVLSPAAHGYVQINWGIWGNPDTFEIHADTNVFAWRFMGSYGTGGEYKGYAVYDVAGLPDNARILQVNLFYDSGPIGSTTFCALSGNPEAQSTPSNAWSFVDSQTNTVYYHGGDFDFIEGATRRHAVFGQIVTDLQSALPGDSFALSVNTPDQSVFSNLALEVYYSLQAVTSSYSAIAVAGPFASWNPRTQPLALIDHYTWRGSCPISDSNLTFKFVANGDWNTANWGDGTTITSFPHDGTAVTSGPDIVYSQPFNGRAVFTLNEQSGQYRVAAFQTDYSSISVAGTFNGWNAGANELELISNRVWQGTIFLLTNNVQFKFVANDDLGANNWGEAATITTFPHTGTGTVFGADIQLGACFSAGNYRFTFDESTARYTVEKLPAATYGGITVAGTFNGWDTLANPLTETEPGVWAGSATLPSGDTAFKFVVGGSWDVGDFGETNQVGFTLPLGGAPEFRGGDIVISNAAAGSHAFRLDLNSCAYEVETNAASPVGSTNALDDANDPAYAGGWSSGNNGGYGFGAWSYSADPNSGAFIGSSTENGGGDPGHDGDIDLAGKAWGLFANSGAILNINRDFNGPLAIGDTLQLDMDNGYVDSDGYVGFNLVGPMGAHGRPTLFTLQFQGGTSNYKISAGGSPADTGIGFTDSGLHFDLAVVDAGGGVGALNVHVAGKAASDGAAFDKHFNGLPISGGDGTIQGIQLFNQTAGSNSDHNLFFNNLKITGAPALPTLAVEGIADEKYGGALALQSVQTSFGDSTLGQVAFANGSELDAGYGVVVGEKLYLLLAGNLETNFNKLEIFLDTRSGGQTRLRGDNPSVDGNGLNRMGADGANTNGLRFDTGFEADYWLGATVGDASGNYSFYLNYAELLTGSGNTNGYYLGATSAGSDGTLSYGYNPFGIKGTIDNRNTNGVTGGTNTSSWGLLYVDSSGEGVATGVELAIPLAAIGNPTGVIKVCAFINAPSHDYLSNQALEGMLVSGYPTHPPANLPSLGEPRDVDFNNHSSRQWFEVQTDCQKGVFQWSQPAYEVRENGNTNLSSYLTLWVNRTEGDCQSVELHYATSNGTATAGNDYYEASSTVSFAQGQMSNSVPFVCLSEGVPEPPETVWITLSDPSTGASLGPVSTAQIVIRDPDEDGDGISDNYENLYFHSLTNCNAASDWDKDGQSDREEACAGTNPDDADSLFHTEIPFQQVSGGTTLVSWASASGRVYRIERATNLLETFDPVATAVGAVPPLNVFTDVVSSASSCFYRIQLESGCP
jgi:hypothetical protein